MPHVLTIGEEAVAVSIAPVSTSQAMVSGAAPESSLDRPLRGNLPPCTWCGDHGFRRMTDDVVLCASDFEYVELHRGNGTW